MGAIEKRYNVNFPMLFLTGAEFEERRALMMQLDSERANWDETLRRLLELDPHDSYALSEMGRRAFKGETSTGPSAITGPAWKRSRAPGPATSGWHRCMRRPMKPYRRD